jgi:hypothetical protein
MAAALMRRLLGVLALCLLLIGALPPSPASAQNRPTVEMRLVSQSAWNDPGRPLHLSFQATNRSGLPLDGLSVVLSIGFPARSRSAYALSLRSDATSTFFSYPFPQKGSLLPLQTRSFTIRQPLDVLTSRGETVLYPLKVELLSGDLLLGTLRTPLIFLSEHPEVPLNLQWTWVFSAPLEYRPDGVFLPGTLEADVSPGGRLAAMATALESLEGVPSDVVMSSVLADQLERMRAGYRIVAGGGGLRTVAKDSGGAAAVVELLASLSTVALRPDTELLAYPFGDPSLPSVARSEIATDLPQLLDRGRVLVESALGATPTKDVVRPPGSQLDVVAMNRLRSLGARTLLIDFDYLQPSTAAPKFTASPVVQLVGARRSVPAVVPEATVLARAKAYPEDPVLAAHVALGELATIWLEFPGTPNRGASLLFGERTTLDPRFYQAFAPLVGSSPWLQPVTARRLVALTPDPERRPIPTRVYPGFNPVYVDHLLATRSAVGQFERTAEGANALVDRLETRLLLAEAGSFIANPLRGRLFIDSANSVIQSTYKRVAVTSQPVTLASRQGLFPVTLRNDTGYTIHVRIVLIADRRVSFVDGGTRNITLDPTQRTLTFTVRAETTGRFPVTVQVQTPGTPGTPQTIAQTEVLVRSTAYNRIALVLTIGAALFLLGWWGRRFLPRRRT